MKKYFISSVVFTALALAACAPKNDTKGSSEAVDQNAIPLDGTGAAAMLCKDPQTGHVKADLFDLYTAARDRHMHIDRDHPRDAHSSFLKFARKWALREMDIRQDTAFETAQRRPVALDYKTIRTRKDLQAFRGQFGLPTQQLISLDQTLAFEEQFMARAKFTDDKAYFDHEVGPDDGAGCKLFHMINVAPDGTPYIRQAIWSRLDTLDQGAAIAHQYLMSKYRAMGATSQFETSLLVAKMYSDERVRSLVYNDYDRLDCISKGKRKSTMVIQFPKDRQTAPVITMTKYWNQLLAEPVSSPWDDRDLFLGAKNSIAVCKMNSANGFVQTGNGPVLKFTTPYFSDEYTTTYAVRCGRANAFDKTTDFEMDLDLFNAQAGKHIGYTCRGMENLNADYVRRAFAVTVQ